jgi:two-component system, NtrC family, response regulator HydG
VEPIECPGLVVVTEDDPAIRLFHERWLGDEGYRVIAVGSGEECLRVLTEAMPDAMLLDLSLPGLGGIEVLERVRDAQRLLPVIITTSDTSVATVVAAMQRGAYDYLTKPIERTKLLTTLKNAVERHRLSVRLAQLEHDAGVGGLPGIVGSSAAMKELFQRIERVAATDVTVLIHGESGTGKELVARGIHERSARSTGPFVALNCAAIPETLQEDELFGHERGAFTGATSQRSGRFELAHRGTLFLDEIGELTSGLQAKLLRVIQERSFQRVGGTAEVHSSFRLLGATNRDLSEEVVAGRFREDLFFRIAVFEVELPPLRTRLEDIPVLAHKFLKDFSTGSGGRSLDIAADALECMSLYGWPGNVRELQNVVQRAAIECVGDVIRTTDLPARVRGGAAPRPSSSVASAVSDPDVLTLEEIERRAIEAALRRTEGNLSRAGRDLGIGRTTLYRKLRKYGLP